MKRQAVICLFLFVGILFLFQVNEDIRKQINKMLMVFLPYFVFIMYMINRGTSFTQALFMNCDHSMLTYSFYKKPEFILKLFRIRLRDREGESAARVGDRCGAAGAAVLLRGDG